MNYYKETIIRRVSSMEKFNKYANDKPFKALFYCVSSSIIVTLILIGIVW